jgi:2-dehydro-3-deoxygluconokinase
MIKIAFFGEAMHELSPDEQPRFGGDSYNTAVYLKRLMAEVGEVYFVSAVGMDDLSAQAQARWQSQALNLRYVFQSDTHTLGTYSITTDKHGERVFRFDRKDSAVRQYFKLDENGVFLKALEQAQFDYLYFSAISLSILDEATRQLFLVGVDAYKRAGGKVIFDSNYRAVLWQNIAQAQTWYSKAYECADVILVTNDDHFGVFGYCSEAQLTAFYHAYPHALVVIKQGTDDTLVLLDNVLSHYSVTPAELVVDTTAAGDAFGAGFLADYLLNQHCADAVNTGQRLAAQVIGARGAIVPTTIASVRLKERGN